MTGVPAHRRRHRRDRDRRRAAGAALALASVACLATGCGNGAAQGLARQACTHVDQALRLYARAQSEGTGPQAGADQAASIAELRAALPIASLAAGQSAHWQALMTTLSESSHVPEAYLVHALTAQCADARSNGL
jgi:hypothetical protein